MTETRHPLRRQLVGLFVLAFIVVVTVGVLIGAIGPDMFSGGGRTIKAVFANTQQLEKDDEVRVGGVQVGTVSGIKLNPGGRSATVSMTVNSKTGTLYNDASAVLQWKTLLGSAFYVKLNPGSPNAGTLGSKEISESHTGDQVELDDVLSIDNGGAKQGLKTMLPQLATGLSDPAPVAGSFSTLGRVAPAVATGVGALRGEDATQDYDLEGLVSHTATVLKALNAPDNDLQNVVEGAAATLGVTSARASDLETALDEATPALAQTRRTFGQLNTTLSLAKPLLGKLGTAAPSVAPTFRDVRPTLTGANQLLHRAVPLLDALPSGAAHLASASKIGLPLLKSVTPDLDQTAADILPYLNAEDPQTQHTTAEMIGPTFEALGPDIAGQMDQNGHFIRFPLSTGNSAVDLNCQEFLDNPSATQLLACESLQTSLQQVLSTNPLGSVEGDNAVTTTSTTPSSTSPTAASGVTPLRSTPPAGTVTSPAQSVGGAVSSVGSTVGATTKSLGSSVSSVLSTVGGSLSNALGYVMTEVRDHRTHSVNRARIQLELSRAARSGIVVAIGLVLGLGMALWIARNIGSTIGQSSQSVSFYVNDANDVVAQSDESRFLGIPDGRISAVTLEHGKPMITATFSTKYGKIYRNARAVLRPNTALEDMYIDVTDPGTPSAGLATAKDPLPAAATDTSVNLDDVLDTFNSDARDSLRSLLDNLGNGLSDHGADLKEAFVELFPTLQAAGQLSDQLADHASLVKELVHNTSTLMGDLSQRQSDLRSLVTNGSAALTTLENGSANLNTILADLPTTLDDLKSGLNATSGVLPSVDTAVKSLDPVASQLPTALSAVRSLSGDANPAIRALQTPVKRLVPLVETLSPLSKSLSEAVDRLSPQVPALTKVVNDLVSCKTGVQGFFEWNPSLAKYGDARGMSPRGNLVIDEEADGVTDSPFETAETACTPGPPLAGQVVTAASEH